MVFSDLIFLYIFLPINLLIYYALPRRFHNLFLLLGGLIFYAWGEPFYVIVMLFSTFIDYLAGLVLWKFDDNEKIRKVALLTSVIMNLTLLGLFKYGVFTVDTINSIFSTNFEFPNLFQIIANSLNLPINSNKGHLPIGISFFTFQSMSYTIDLYKRNIKVQKNLITFTAFVTLFPQIVAGPIVRYEHVAKELDHRNSSIDMMYSGISQFIIGLSKKVLIANNIGELWSAIKETPIEQLSVTSAWLGILAFTFQIYFDFSGYSDMAIGLGRIFGFNFPINFDYPYMSRSVSEFWRRWHITLGEWFKSYVYFPLGGSRCSNLKQIRNLAVVWLLTGIWHGANMTFILWGCFYGVLIIAEKMLYGKYLLKIPRFLSVVYTMFFVIIGWVIFDLPSVPSAFNYMGKMFNISNTAFIDDRTYYSLLNYGILFLICIIFSTTLPKKLYEKLQEKAPIIINYAEIPLQAAAMLLSTAYLANASYNPFLYFNF